MIVVVNCICPKCGEELEEEQDVDIEPQMNEGYM